MKPLDGDARPFHYAEMTCEEFYRTRYRPALDKSVAAIMFSLFWKVAAFTAFVWVLARWVF